MQPEPNIRRVGVLGAGVMGRRHIDAWQRLGVPIAGVYARDPMRGRAAAETCGCQVFDSVTALLDAIEIADICLPTFLHRSTVEQAAQAGCDIICEKPLALESEDAEAVFALCEDAGVRLFVAMVVRFFSAYRKAWQTVRGGTLGAVRTIALERVGSPPPPEGSWFFNSALSGDMLTDLLIHDVDYATWLAGDVAAVHATVHVSGRLQYAYLTLEHTNGTVSRIKGGWADAAPGLQARGQVVCADGKIQITPKNSYLPTEDPYVAELRHFHDALVSGGPFLVSRSEVLRVVRIMAAAREAARSRCTMPIGPADAAK